MARGYLVFGDIVGALDVLRVERAQCDDAEATELPIGMIPL